MSNFEQLIRIALYTVGGIVLGDGVASSAEFQAGVGGIIATGSFVWWLIRNRGAR